MPGEGSAGGRPGDWWAKLHGMARDAWWERQRSSFGDAAGAYERGRPVYPQAALDWLLPPGARRVLDLGAGTGKLTRLLVARGLDVVAVEPSPGMRAEFARVLPGVPLHDGTAEELPLPDRSVDAVLVAQAWHWVDPPRAVPEVARVLTAGGGLGLVWNVRDRSVDWVVELEQLIEQPGQDDGRLPDPGITAPFGPVEEHDVPWSTELDRAGLIDLVASRSYVITMPPARRERLFEDVRHLLDTHPDVAGRDRLDLPYVARCFRTALVR